MIWSVAGLCYQTLEYCDFKKRINGKKNSIKFRVLWSDLSFKFSTVCLFNYDVSNCKVKR